MHGDVEKNELHYEGQERPPLNAIDEFQNNEGYDPAPYKCLCMQT